MLEPKDTRGNAVDESITDEMAHPLGVLGRKHPKVPERRHTRWTKFHEIGKGRILAERPQMNIHRRGKQTKAPGGKIAQEESLAEEETRDPGTRGNPGICLSGAERK